MRLMILMCLVWGTQAAVIEIGPQDSFPNAIQNLQPGDVLELRTGDYILTSRLGISLDCTPQQPCIVRAKEGHSPHIQRPTANQNIIDIEFSNYLTFQGLEFSGGSRGLRIRESSFITIEDCDIHDTGDAAIAANDTGSMYEGLRLIRNHIYDTNNTGEGLYLGCNENRCQMFNSVIEGNYIHNTDGQSVTQGDGIEIKEGSWGNVVRDNVIHDTNYPCILTYSTVGNGPPNIIERNVMWGCGDHAIQSAADAVIRNNIILGAAADGIRNQPHQNGAPNNLTIVHNTILAPSGSALRLNGVVGSVTIANNALYAQSGAALRAAGDLTNVTALNNVGQGSLVGLSGGFDGSGSIATDFVSASFSGGLPQDVFPQTQSALIGSANAAWLVDDDFNRTARYGDADVGVYRYRLDGNPGWTLAAEFKPYDLIFYSGFDELP